MLPFPDLQYREIAVNDALLVGRFDSCRNLQPELQGIFDRYRSTLQSAGKRVSLDKLENDESRTGRFFKTVYRCDVWMVQRSEQPGFAFESRQAFGVVGKLLGQRLQSDFAPSFLSRARHTSPMPPLPSAARIS